MSRSIGRCSNGADQVVEGACGSGVRGRVPVLRAVPGDWAVVLPPSAVRERASRTVHSCRGHLSDAAHPLGAKPLSLLLNWT